VYLACNPPFERLYGAREADILGKTDAHFVPADVAQAFRENDLAALAADAPRINEEWLDFASDGYRGLFETTKLPVRDSQGRVLGVMGMAHDITQRRRDEEQLHLAASVFVHAREGIMITQADGTILQVNNTFTDITGYTREDVIGRNPRLFQSGLQDRSFYVELWRSLTEKGHWYGELWNRRKNGECVPAAADRQRRARRASAHAALRGAVFRHQQDQGTRASARAHRPLRRADRRCPTACCLPTACTRPWPRAAGASRCWRGLSGSGRIQGHQRPVWPCRGRPFSHRPGVCA
jgi:PAS domain S-box-containing protein